MVIGIWLPGCTPLSSLPIRFTAAVSPTATTTPTQSLPLVSSPTPSGFIQVNEERLQGVSIRLWHPYLGELGASLERLAEEFSRVNQWKIFVESEAINGVDLLNERMKVALTQGGLPDLVVAPTYQALRWHEERSVLADWSSYIEDAQWGLPFSEQDQFYPNLWTGGQQEKLRWGIPARRVAQLLFYNASWAKEWGFDAAPATLDEFKLQSCSVRGREGEENEALAKGYLFTHDYPTILAWFVAFGGSVFDPERQVYQFESEEVREALTYLRTLYEQGCTQGGEDADPVGAFVHRQALFVPGSSGQLNLVSQTMKDEANLDRWTVLPFPTADGEGIVVLYGTDFILIRSSPQKQLAAWLFVKWLLREENQYQLAKETLGLPLHKGAGEALKDDPDLLPEFRTAVGYLPLGVQEPLWASWDTVRWAVSDSSRQLVAWYFSLDQVASLVQLLEKTAADLHSRLP
ncbi:MAG: extracellular solute-binding protein [Anaerolineales bacterium]|nr:extracellular solute-binding protein [Anaerolineales bacterium]MDW8162577.1 extracellular solute-binding protein [Anaerolineales bacterium]